jgi:intein/homing endonuclease
VNTINKSNLVDEPSSIYNYFKIMSDNVYELTTISGRKIQATGDHPFLVCIKPGKCVMKKMEDLTKNDKVVIWNMVQYLPDDFNYDVGLLNINIKKQFKRTLLTKMLLGCHIPYDKLLIISRLCGLYYASSSIYMKSPTKRSYYSKIKVYDVEDVYQVGQDLDTIGFIYKVSYNNELEFWEIFPESSFAYFISIFGCDTDTYIPEWIINGNNAIKREFLSALHNNCDTLKILHTNLPTMYKIVSEKMLPDIKVYYENVSTLFSDLKIKNKLEIQCIEDNGYMLFLKMDENIVNVIHYYNLIAPTYSNKNRILQSTKYEYLRTIQYTQIDLDYITFIKENGLKNGMVCIQISSICKTKPQYVYDFTTESSNHSFVASSFVVSNCSETPEGQSVGVVKNLSYMTHVTIHSNSVPIYGYIQPYIKELNSIDDVTLIHKSIKVFVNGCWLGITEQPIELYKMLKVRKYNGTINIYTSIVFDFINKEIRVCNDSGRLTRPLLKVKDNNILIDENITKKIEDNEISWDDLLITTKIPESVIEYIDPEEQSMSLIAMNVGVLIDNTMLKLQKYTHA